MSIMSDTWIREMAVSYADRAGKYMRQTGVTLPRL